MKESHKSYLIFGTFTVLVLVILFCTKRTEPEPPTPTPTVAPSTSQQPLINVMENPIYRENSLIGKDLTFKDIPKDPSKPPEIAYKSAWASSGLR